MSGRKDYRVTLERSARASVAREAARQARLEAARQRAIQAAEKARQEAAKQRAIRAAEKSQQEARARTRSQLESSKRTAEREREAARARNMTQLERARQAAEEAQARDEQARSEEQVTVTGGHSHPAPIEAEAADTSARIQESKADTEALAAWSKALHEDTEVAEFMSSELQQWEHKRQDVLADVGQHESEALISDAETILDAARVRKEKQEDRESLVQKIVESMEEIGFFVDAPHLADANNRLSDVVITAVRGEEKVESFVGLEDEVKSEWGDIHRTHCTSSFVEYVRQMKRRGVDVQPLRDDLVEQPKLKRAGEKDLPSQREIGGA